MLSGQIKTPDGYTITDGFVSIHSPNELSDIICKDKNSDIVGRVLHKQFLTAFETDDSRTYKVTKPFPLIKVASTLHKLCKENQISDRYNRSFITFFGINVKGQDISAVFNTRHIINAFECVGAKAVGHLMTNPSLFSGDTFLLISQTDRPKDLSNGAYAIVLQSKYKGGM